MSGRPPRIDHAQSMCSVDVHRVQQLHDASPRFRADPAVLPCYCIHCHVSGPGTDGAGIDHRRYSIIPVAIVGSGTFYSIFSDILGFIGYWLAPYVAVVLVEHVLFRRARWSSYNVSEAWDNQKHPNLAPSYCSIVTFVLSVGFVVLCMDKPWWVGPIARAGTGDVGMLLGFIFGLGVYAAVRGSSGRKPVVSEPFAQ